jgi:TonB family protein
VHRIGPHFHLLGMFPLLLSAVHPAFGSIVATQSDISNSEVKAPRREPIKVGGNSSEDHRRHIVYPVYPESAKRDHIEGNVKLILTVNEEGFVYDVARTPGNNSILEESAVEAVKKWQFGPWLLMGEPIPVLKAVTIPFVWKDRDDVRVWLDDSGLSCDMKQILESRGEVWIEAHASYQCIEDLYRELTRKGVQRVHWLGYQAFQNRLFLSRDMIDKGGPNFNVSDIDRINQLALASEKFGRGSEQSLRFSLYFDQSLAFIGLQRLEGPEIPEVQAALQQIRPIISMVDRPIAISFNLPIAKDLRMRLDNAR